MDIAVVETGLGGVSDATNVFQPPNLSLAVITAIGLEHEAALGIIKRHTLCTLDSASEQAYLSNPLNMLSQASAASVCI